MRQLRKVRTEYGRVQIFYGFLRNRIGIFAFMKKVRNIKTANKALVFLWTTKI